MRTIVAGRLRGASVALAAGLGLCVTSVAAQPYRPQDDAVVLERLPSAPVSPSALRGRELPPELAAKLAQTFIERARQTGDPRELGYARGVMQRWWNTDDAPDAVLLLRATLRQAQHDFDGALADLDRLLARRPDDAQAWLTRATVLRVQGRYTESAQACAELRGRASAFVAELCGIAVRGLAGDLVAMRSELDRMAAQADEQPAAIAAWFEAERADMAVRAGDASVALTLYRKAVQQYPQDLDLRASLADLLLDRDEPRAVLELIDEQSQADALRLRRALALRALKDPSFPVLDRALRDGFDAAHRRGEALHLREEARYRLATGDDPSRVLTLAQANWQVQHEPWDVRLLLEAAAAADQPDAATPVHDWIRASGFTDARLGTRP